MQTIAHSKIMRTFATAIEKDTLKERKKTRCVSSVG